MKLKILLPAFLLMLSSLLMAQSEAPANWQSAGSDKNINVFTSLGSCLNKDIVFLKLENNNSYDVRVIISLWKEEKKEIILKANQVVSGSCAMTTALYTSSVPEGKNVADMHLTFTSEIQKK
ncbi:MAG: hypothetical protein M3R27_14500 [Bacteroidota bacterium]|nr:hypothetical protein [Bacteroidota bacterium]